MKKISCALILVITLLFSLSATTFSSKAAETENGNRVFLGGFEFISEEITQEINTWFTESGDISFTLTKEIETSDSELGNSITIKITRTEASMAAMATSSSGTLNFALSGRYYFKSSDTTISNYGIHGSVDYSISNSMKETIK